MTDISFFDKPTEQSKIKSRIVEKYFRAWAKVIIPSAQKYSKKIAYIDLYSGPGRYDDGTKSTPILILEQAAQDTNMQSMLVTMFNDKKSKNIHSLKNAIALIKNISNLKYKPKIMNTEVGEKIIEEFERIKLIPSLLFVDPWGYKGLSCRLFKSVLKNWGCDCIFFFNYNRINPGISNPSVTNHMNDLFGEDNANKLRRVIKSLKSSDREKIILDYIVQALKDIGGEYVIPFRFMNERGTRTSHYLIFVSKDIRGHNIMKDIMAKESYKDKQGVPTFEYNSYLLKQPCFEDFEINQINELTNLLLVEFANKTLKMKEIFDQHNIGKVYIKNNYKEALKLLESKGLIITDPPAENRKKDTFGDNVIVTF